MLKVIACASRGPMGALLCGASLMSVACAQPAQAQEQQDSPSEGAAQSEGGQVAAEIIVTGIREAVKKSLEKKRDATGIVDVITAEDVGKLPDQNVVETLQRVPGVQINRSRGGSQQNPSGEGQSFSIRGITQNRVEFNGTNITGAASSGVVQLSDFTPDIVAAIVVKKTPSAEDVAGALGGVVNVITRKPLDVKPFGSVKVEGIYYDQAGKLGWRASGVKSLHITDTLGLLVRATRYEYKRDTYLFSTDGYVTTDAIDVTGDGVSDPGLTRPNRLVFDDLYARLKRTNISGTLQWRPSALFETSLDVAYTNLDMVQDASRYQLLLSDSISGAKADDAGTVYTGTFLFPTPRVSVYNEPIEQNQLVATLKGKWTPADDWKVDFSASHSEGDQSRSVDTPLLVPKKGLYERIYFDLTAPADLPTVNFPLGNYDRNTPGNYALNTFGEATDLVDNWADEARFAVAYDTGLPWIATIESGVRYARTHYSTDRFSRNLSGAAVLADNPGLDVDGDGQIGFEELVGINLRDTPRGSLFSGFSGDFPRHFLGGSVDIPALRDEFGLPLPPHDLNGVRVADGETVAAYVQASLDGHLFGIRVRGNVGVRYVDYKRVAAGWVQAEDDATYTEYPARFRNWLPSINLKFDLAKDLVFRLAAARVVSNPPLTAVAPGVRLNVVRFRGSRGNPGLKPFTAKQYDASLEWYFDEASNISVALFYKDVDSFTVGRSITEYFDNGAYSGDYVISEPINGTNGSVKGVEFGYQQIFKGLPKFLKGLGAGLNYTFTDSDTPLVNAITGEMNPMPGLSKHSYNGTLFLEQGWGNVRLTYNWRGKYLDKTGGASVGGNLYQDDFGHFDASAQFNITKKITFNLIGVNLTKTPQVLYMYDEGRLRDFRVNDRRIYAGITAKF